MSAWRMVREVLALFWTPVDCVLCTLVRSHEYDKEKKETGVESEYDDYNDDNMMKMSK